MHVLHWASIGIVTRIVAGVAVFVANFDGRGFPEFIEESCGLSLLIGVNVDVNAAGGSKNAS